MRARDRVIAATFILAVASLVGIALTTGSYIQGMRSARGLRLMLSEVRIDDPANRFTVVMHLQNRATVPLRLDDINLSFYVNGQYVGSNYQRFVARTVQPGEEPVLDFTVPLQPFYRQRLYEARATGRLSWEARGVARLLLPYRDRTLLVSIREQWSGNP